MQAQELFPGIVSDPGILGGKAVIKGTRVPVALVLGQLAGGVSLDEICQEYHLSPDQVRTALDYAVHLVSGEIVYAPVP